MTGLAGRRDIAVDGGNDGKELLYLSATRELMAVDVFIGGRYYYDAMADGQRFVFPELPVIPSTTRSRWW